MAHVEVASMVESEMAQAVDISGEVSSSTHLAMVEGSRSESQCRAFVRARVVQCSRVGGVGPQNAPSESFARPYQHRRHRHLQV
jgi:hypothetical protein